MKKRWIALTLVLSLLLVGCGKDKKPEETKEAQVPVFTEANNWVDDSETFPWDVETEPTEAVTEETVPPTEETVPETTAAPTEPKDDPHIKAVDQTVYVVGRVNVRNAAGFNSQVLGQLKGGDQVRRTGIGDHGWSRIEYEGKTAYVANNYLTVDPPEKADGATFKEVNQQVRATAKVNIRSGPSVNYDVIGELQANEEVQRTAIGDKGWSRIVYNGKNCYVSNSYLRTVKVNSESKDKSTEQTETKLEPLG